MFSREGLDYEPLPLPDRVEVSDAERSRASLAFLETMRRRHTVRDFSTREVPQSVIEAAVQTAGSAPSGANHQPWHFAAVADLALKQRIRAAAAKHRFQQRKDVEGSLATLEALATRHGIDLVAIGNGTASRETEALVQQLQKRSPKLALRAVMVSEAGASVYSAMGARIRLSSGMSSPSSRMRRNSRT